MTTRPMMMMRSLTMSKAMNNHSDIAAAWIVALALIAAIVVHVFLPATPPRLGHGVADAEAARVGINLSGATETSDSDLPLNELRDVFRLHFGNAAAAADTSEAPAAQ
jgi:hypothetical protein